MKKIIYIGNALSKHGFNQTSVETLGAFLRREGHEVAIGSDKKNWLLRILDMLYVVWKHRKFDYAIIDTYSTYNFWAAWAVSQWCRLLRVDYVAYLHGGMLPMRLKKSPMFCKMIFNHSLYNAAPSNYLLEAFEKAGYGNLKFLPNVIDLKHYDRKQRAEAQPKLLWVRAFADIYNPTMAVEVLYELKKLYPNASLCMVGPDKDGSLAITQAKAKELGVEVLFTGRLSKPEWTKLAAEYDLFINTTHYDNTPVSVMEAMALGLGVVSTNVGGIPYLLDDQKDALLVADGDVQGMTNALKDLIENPNKFQHITQEAYTKVKQMDWEVVKKMFSN